MSEEQPNYPLHGITLKAIVEDLVERRGFADLGTRVRARCFTHDPSVKSALVFLRRNPWAREEIEELYLRDHMRMRRMAAREVRRKTEDGD